MIPVGTARTNDDSDMRDPCKVRRTRDDNQAVRLLRVANETLRELRERYAKRAKPAPLDDVNAPLPI